MPVHDWAQMSAGTFHDFHVSWVLEIKRSLARGILPKDYYVMTQRANESSRRTYTRMQRTLVIRHASDDRIVAMIEVLSAGNKSSRHAIRSFVDKSLAALDGGIHLLLVDVHSPGPRDPNGIHGVLLNEISTEEYAVSGDHPLTTVAYNAGAAIDAFVAHFAVGDTIPQMPLFLTRENYVYVPLEETYMAAWQDVPGQYQRALCEAS